MVTTRAIGIDLGGTNLRGALVELGEGEATILRQERRTVGEDRSPETVARALAALVRELSPAERLPVGVGIAAMLRGTTGVVANAPNLGWRDVPFARLAEAELGQPVWLDNDVNVIVWGEQRFGAARGKADVLCVFGGTGVGAGAVCDGRLYRGAGNASLELGHVKVVENGRACGCGARGCVEAYAGGRHLVEQVREQPSAVLLELVQGRLEALHAGHVDEAARRGDERARGVIDEAARWLGLTLANAVTLFNPGCLLLGGTVWVGCPRLREGTLGHFRRLVNVPALDGLTIADAVLGDDAGVLGAADLGRRELGR